VSWPCLVAFVSMGGFGLSHDEVKRAVGLFYSFVYAIASGPCDFLYHKQQII